MIPTADDYLVMAALAAMAMAFLLAFQPGGRDRVQRRRVAAALEFGAAGRAWEGNHVADVGHAGDELHSPFQA